MPKCLFHPKNFVAKLASFGSHCLSRLLLTTIVAFVLFSAAEAAGPLSVRTTNPRYFFDANGRAVYLAGSYQNPYNLLNSGPGNFSTYFDFLAQQNHNFTRLWAWEESPWIYDQNGQVTFSIQPYERTGPGLALDGGLKFDLTRFNQAYFDQLRARVIQAGQRGIYVSLILFEGFSSQRKVRQVNPWLADPFQRDNNVNGINADPNGNGSGEEFFSLSYPSLTALQEAFVRQVVDTLNDLDNVLYEVSGDTLLTSLSWQYHMIDYVKSYQSTKPNQHPVGISQFYAGNLAAIFNSQADWIVILGTNFHPPLAKANKVLFLEGNPTLFQYDKSDQWVWRTFTRGYNPIYPEPQSPIGGINDSVHAAIGQTRSYSQFVNLASMSPSNNVCSTDFCLASPGTEYLVYVPSGGRISVDLSASSRNLLTAWFDTATGQTISGNTVSGGTQVVFTSPILGQSVLQILADGLVSSQTAGTSNSTSSSNTTTTSSASSSQNNGGTVATPTITPNGGIYSDVVTVTLKTNTGGATIYYTTDGQSPTQSAKKYAGAFTLAASTLVKAKAFKNNFNPSAEASAWFTKADTGSFNFTLSNSGDKSVNAGSSVTNSIAATLGSGSAQSVSFSASGLPSGATASFSSASCSPTCSTVLSVSTTGATTTGNFPVTVTAVGGGVTRTTAFNLSVTGASTVATPTITPSGGSFTTSVSVTIQTATSGASIYYTTDGSSPTQSSTLYTGAITLTSSAVVKAKAFMSGYTASAEASASFTKQVVGASDLVGYWKFDEGTGTTVSDSSGNGNTGTLTNGPLWTAGRIGNALYFDGINDSITIPDSNSLDLSGSFTFSAWVNPVSTFTDFRSILVKNYKYFLYASGAGYCGDGSPLGGFSEVTNQTVCQPSPLPANAWTYLALSYNGSTLTLYRDGIPVATSNATGALSATTGTLQIGASQFGEYFQGLIDEVRIYKRALTDTEIQTIYQQESANTSQSTATPVISPNGGSYSGNVSVTMQSATSGASIYFTTDGTTPTQSSSPYAGTVTLTSSATVKAKAFKNGYNPSAEADASLTVTQPFDFSLSNSGNQSVVAGSSVNNTIATALVSGSSQAVSFSVSGLPSGATGSFSSPSCSPACSTVLNISISGSTPTGSFPITISATGSGVTKTTAFTLSVTLALAVATPTLSPNGGNFAGFVSVAIQSATSGAPIYYTTDGSTPTQSSTLYTGAMTLTNSATVNAKAFKSGYSPSAVASASFTNTLTGTTGTGKTYYVAKTGSDSNSCSQAQSQSTPKLTISGAFGCLQPGDTLYVRAGTYTEEFYYPAIAGTSWFNPVTLSAFSGDTVTIRPTGGSCGAPCRIFTFGPPHQYIVINAFILDCANCLYDVIKFDNGAHHIRFSNNEIKNGHENGILGGNNNELINNDIHDNGTTDFDHGIYNSGPGNLIQGNKVHHNKGWGIHIYNSGYTTISDNIVRGNYVYSNGTSGTRGPGILLGSGSNNIAYNNIVQGNIGGIQIGFSAVNATVYNNTIYSNRGDCINVGSASNTVAKNNICYLNNSGITDAGVGTIQSNNLMSDPIFVNPAASDFHLQSGSSAINTGINLFSVGVTTDFDGFARPQAGNYDIGVYEYH